MTTKSKLLSEAEALKRLLNGISPLRECEEINLLDAHGRVTSRPLIAQANVPGFDNSAMDGYAINSRDINPTSETCLEITQRIAAGQNVSTLSPGSAARIFTGAPIPPGADTVVMQENCREQDGQVFISPPVTPGKHIRKSGEDIQTGDRILDAGAMLRPQEMGLAASLGCRLISVFRRVRVSIIMTGNELVTPGTPLEPGKIYNSNLYTLSGLLSAHGCEVIHSSNIPDNLDATTEALAQAAETSDLIITSGGVSVGEEDYVKHAIARLGELHIQHIAIKPGKPLTYGDIKGTAVLGLPGNPVSLFVTFLVFAHPAIRKLQGRLDPFPTSIWAQAQFERSNPIKRREYLRARFYTSEGCTDNFVKIHPRQGSAVLSSAGWANCLAIIPENSTVTTGQPIELIPFSELLC